MKTGTEFGGGPRLEKKLAAWLIANDSWKEAKLKTGTRNAEILPVKEVYEV